MPAAVTKPKPYKTYQAKAGEVVGKWYIVDAADKPLGRVAVPIARRLMGKDKATYTPHLDTGDFVVVINAERIKVHPKKIEGKVYRQWSGYPGGLHTRTFAEQLRRNPTKIILDAVRRMLPKTILGKAMLSKLKVYTGTKHPHAAQKPVAWAPLG